jgi:hypothetical protein
MPFEIDLRGNVPVYGQQFCIWCGAACAQMIMNGYPNPADRVFHPQVDCWNTIQVHNSTAPADAAWATDPEGLEGCLMDLNPPPPPGSWHVFMNSDRDALMFWILYYMNKYEYPVTTLINRGGHWVVIVRYVSDVEPVAGSTPNLQTITKYDPEPHNVGSVSTMSAAVWYATDWIGPVQYAGSWHNNYVAVIEPPETEGRVKVARVTRIGAEIITPERAVEYARTWIRKLQLGEKPPYTLLRKKGIINLQPIVVREEIRPGLEEENVPHYYIVPFGFERETEYGAVPNARICIIVNAFTGDYEETTVFGKPVRYLTEKEAINTIAKAMGLKKEEIQEIKATMMYQPSDITHIRTYPFWKITIRERVLYVDQLGKVYRTIKPSVPGD